MGTTTIRVSTDVRDLLAEIASAEGKTSNELIRSFIAEHQKREFFKKLGEDFARLRADKEAWAEYQSEVALWDTALLDGLEDETPWDE